MSDKQPQIDIILQKLKHEQEKYQQALKQNKIYSILKGHRIVIKELRRELLRLENNN
jgi:hypothetical protein